MAGSTGAVFVVLKPGIGYDEKRGTYVADAAVQGKPRLPAYRFRVIGVYDTDTGKPVSDVQLVDAASGTWAFTSATGTAALSFLPDGGGMLRLRKKGYVSDSLAVTISPSDTMPITMLLTKSK
jgi:hypothetical protein